MGEKMLNVGNDSRCTFARQAIAAAAKDNVALLPASEDYG
jgi:hypothetical protein